MRRLGAVCGLLVALSGHAVAQSYDGQYAGVPVITWRNADCATQPRTIVINGNWFSGFFLNANLIAKVQPDGSFAASGNREVASHGRVELTGRVDGKKMRMTWRAPFCEITATLDRTG